MSQDSGYNTFRAPLNQGNIAFGKIRIRPYGKGYGKIATSFGNYNKEILIVELQGTTLPALLTSNTDISKETAKLYDLTEAEQELLLARKRGHALFMVGAKRLHINFGIPQYKLDYMGNKGGR